MSRVRSAAFASMLVVAAAVALPASSFAQAGFSQPADLLQVGHKPKKPKKLKGVPELSADVAGAALVLAIGGVLVLTGRRRRESGDVVEGR